MNLFLIITFLGVAYAALNLNHHHMWLDAVEPFSLQDPENWYWFTQKLDHFNIQEQHTWKQRYCTYKSPVFKNGQPIFIYISGEARMRDNTCNTGYHITLADRFKGAAFALEHRFYGESYPIADLTVKSLSYLTSKQALYDLAAFTTHWKEKYPDSPFIIVGGSYSGVLASVSRLMFPHLYIGAWASSGPNLAKENFFEYDRVVGESLGVGCRMDVHLAMTKIEQMLDQPSTRKQIKRYFKCENVTNDVEFLYVLADAVSFAVQYNYIGHLCNRMKQDDPVYGLSLFTEWLFDFLQTDPVSWTMSSHTSTKKDVNDGTRQWIHQSCQEFGYWQVADPKDPLRSKKIDIKFHRDLCKQLYGYDFVPNTSETNMAYGALDFAGTNVAFSNGGLDPWKSLSLTSLSSKQKQRGCTSVVIKGSAHCADLHAPSSKDSDDLRDAREFMTNRVVEWLKDFYMN
ncbi:hypothetical protein GEMRC1_003437 [Eukaryota sp. GEM-RC1]